MTYINAHNVVAVVYLQFDRIGFKHCIELTVIYAAISCAANKMHANKAPKWLIVLLQLALYIDATVCLVQFLVDCLLELA